MRAQLKKEFSKLQPNTTVAQSAPDAGADTALLSTCGKAATNRAPPRGVLYARGTAMLHHEVAHDREADAGAGRSGRAGDSRR